LGAILADENSGDVFVKMTGPQAVVQAASVLFSEMITQACETRGEAGLLPAGNP
jgi:hypothetical protein